MAEAEQKKNSRNPVEGYNSIRRRTPRLQVGSKAVGGDSPLTVQSMTNTDTHDLQATYEQVRRLVEAGCDIVRLAVPDREAAKTFFYLKNKGISVPLVADIHYDYRIALSCVEAGADKIRINPGNIGDDQKVKAVADACRGAGIPIRIGVNGGSLEKSLLAKYGAPTPEALAESALYHASLLEKFDFRDIVLSVKASDVPQMIAANRLLAQRTDYPLHLGVTEAGGLRRGRVKSAVGIGTLLAEGIGDTLRVSLTADPVLEVGEAKAILDALDLNPQRGMDVISCPTCGRTKIELIRLLEEFEAEADKRGLWNKPLRVAFMGCAVNGIGEAREADIGIAGGDGEALIFRHGVIGEKYPADKIVCALADEIEKL